MLIKKAISLHGLPVGKAKSSSAAPALASGDQAAISIFSHGVTLARNLGCQDLEICAALIGSVVVIAGQAGKEPGEIFDQVLAELTERNRK